MNRAFACACLAAILAMAGVPTAEAKQCKGKAERVVSPALFPESSARQAAGLAWIHLVQLKYGQLWAHPGLAAETKVSCVKAPTGVGGFVYTCVQTARPCRL